MAVLGIDLGYGFTKGVVTGSEEKFLCQSLIGSSLERVLSGGLFGTNHPDDIQVDIERGGTSDSYFIGELARRESTDVTYTMDENKIDHPLTQVLLCAASAVLWPGKDAGPVHLVTGLPMSHYKTQKAKLEENLRKLDAKVRIPGKNTGWVPVKFDRVTVFMQGYGAAYAAVLDENGKPRDKEVLQSGGLVVVIESGHKTTDVVTFETKPKFRPVDHLSFSLNLGGDNLAQTMLRVFQEKAGAQCPASVQDQWTYEGQLWYDGKEVNAKRELDQARERLGQTIMDRIRARFGDNAGRVSTVFLAGRNAPLVEQPCKSTWNNVRVVDNPQFANAEGYRIVGEMLERKATARSQDKIRIA
ncbi:ParM/StbA family protein [Alicyclobacillus sp. SO9]|uniref:ParM/StbA family protein n=1 Tax=Alicyclobacillus sp. SO9 TaxID=2665646 RepID=UPI0018E8B5AA|nr:ParM/StbA family protein [Alicyclobacillus sp. SO9]QQE79561.1 ParM/StbA family protein [Alicyclobacillus sp. SO9]